jgi:Mrp family chromosome partitioning ATPase
MDEGNTNGAQKFANFDRLLAKSRGEEIDCMIVNSPHVLGDTYAELVTNLNKIAAAGLALRIVPPEKRAAD